MATRIAALTFSVLFLSLVAVQTASAQTVADPVPLLNGTEKAKQLYSIPYVLSSPTTATCVSCTHADKSGTHGGEFVGVELFEKGSVENDLTSGEGVDSLGVSGDTDVFCTRDVASISFENTMGATAEDNIAGSGRVVGTTNKLICTAFLVSVAGDPPSFMTILPMYKGNKQKGGM